MERTVCPFFPCTDETEFYDPRLRAAKLEGHLVWFEGDPEPYVDCLMSYSSTNFGHCNPAIMEIVQRAISRGDNLKAFHCREREEVSRLLIGLLPFAAENMQVCFPVGGARVVEEAVKLARAGTGKKKIIVFEGAYHGQTLGTIPFTDPVFFDARLITEDPTVLRLPFPAIHRNIDPADVLSQMEKLLRQDDIAAVLIEPIQGAAGFLQAEVSFFRGLRALTKKCSVPLIIDEVQMACYRTGPFYCFERYGIEPDIIVVGKSLAGGYYPLSAVIAHRRFFDAAGTHNSSFDSTFDNSIFGLAIAGGVLAYAASLDLPAKIQKQETLLKAALEKIAAAHPAMTELSVAGLACGWKMPDAVASRALRKAAFAEHLILQCAGTQGDRNKISPSLRITDEELAEALQKLEKAFGQLEKNT